MLKVAYSDRFVLDLPEGHKFPMLKYELIRGQLLYEGTLTEDQFYDPGLVPIDIALLTHDKVYINSLIDNSIADKEIRRIGFPRSNKLFLRSRSSVYGTLTASLNSLEYGIGMNTAGGTHHAYSDRGEGFCLMNDIAVSANYLLSENRIKKALVIDLDVHQGNGTAKIFQNNNNVFTFSMHGADNYPLKKEQSDLDIALKVGTTDSGYLELLEKYLDKIVDMVKPDIVFYQAGVDILSTDKLGKLALTRNGCKERDYRVFDACFNRGIPLNITMGGGYSEKISDIVEAHCNTFRIAVDYFG